ncbi:MOSC domain-containing protein [Ilumatobacter nonamiensis]|uniref:MOSC domain-containing protein n=1 Tax=Ilumatobacter nonamiensis TaxID=467093 RepID=UPI00034D8C98|nr:MOSC domain-containing protein [Ilumatobacter nonamiensis]
MASTAPLQHLDRAQLEDTLDHVRASPAEGTLELIVQRPGVDERVVLDEARLNTDEGLEGDTWKQRSSKRTDDGSPHPDMQLNIMNSRILGAIAQSADRMELAGDQLIVDMDLSDANLPAWTKLAVGDAVIQITDQPHTGCAKFSQRFGVEAHRFVNSEVGKELHLRGINARVVSPGTIRRGDPIRKL